MKKRITLFTCLILALCMGLALAACTTPEPPAPDYGTLTIANVTLQEGETKALNPTFSKEASAITYSFTGDNITIANDQVTAVKPGTVTVSATTEHHEATFTVTVTAKPVDYGTLSVENIAELEVGTTATIEATFSIADKAEPITYTFEGEDIEIADGVVTALVGGKTVTVTAKTEHHEATFTVTTIVIDYGTLTIANVTNLKEGNKSKLFPTFSNNKYVEDITYTFEGDAIKIEDGYVTALKGGETVTVTATTSHHETTFTVSTVVNRGELTVNNVYAWVDYPASDFYPTFSMPEYAEELAYEYDSEALEIDTEKNTVKAFKAGRYTVKATSANFMAEFTVNAEVVDKNADGANGKKKYNSDFSGAGTQRHNTWKNQGKDNVSTAFIGDSFFDGFWSNFYEADYYGNYEAVRIGVSATTTYDWEQFAYGWLSEINPKNLVMHMGTNNVYDDGDNAATATSALQRMFTVIHDKLPGVKIYWFSISQRSYDAGKQATVSVVNANMKTWCDERDYITYIHTVDTLTADMLKDSVHPKPECYTVFRDALKKTDIEIAEKPKDQGVNMGSVGHAESSVSFDKATGKLTASSPAGNKRAASYLKNDGAFVKGDFVVSGTITTASTSGWIALFVNSNANDGWFNADNELPAAAIIFSAGNANVWGYKAGGANGTVGAFQNVTFAKFDFTVVSSAGKVLWLVGNSYKEITLSAGAQPFFGIVNESNTISATITADFDAKNAADAYEKVKAGVEVPDYGSKVEDFSNTMTETIANGKGVHNVYYKSGVLNRNFILEGKLDITESGSNAHIQFGIDGGSNRVLLWDNDSNKSFLLCIPYITSGVPADDTYMFESGKTLTIEWKIVMTDDDMYFFIGNELKIVYTGLPGGDLKLGSEAAAVKFYDMTAKTKVDDGAAYDEAIKEYASIISQYGNNAAGKVRV